jgi:hypothetical protein
VTCETKSHNYETRGTKTAFKSSTIVKD